jgi:hypothetical protein
MNHLTDQQLIVRLYTGEADPHFDTCQQCQLRYARMERHHAAMGAPPVPDAYLEQQLRQIENRLETAPAPWAVLRSAWVPAAVATALLVGILFFRPGTNLSVPAEYPEETAVAEPGVLVEASWFEEAYSKAGSIEPLAASPIRELFAEEVTE